MEDSVRIHIQIPKRILLALAGAIYALAFICLKFFRDGFYVPFPSYNWIPFYGAFTQQAFISIVWNALIWLPYGFFVASSKKKILASVMGLSYCFVLELLQPIFRRGIFDATTIVVSAVGMTAGFFLYKAFRKILSNTKLRFG